VQACFDEKSFLYFDAADDRDLARAIRQLHASPEMAARLVERATVANEPFRWPRQRELYLSLMRQVVDAGLPSSNPSVPQKPSRPWSGRVVDQNVYGEMKQLSSAKRPDC
jgi:hypothetical protein